MFTIENQQLKVVIQAKGAELFSVYHKEYQLEYLWNADPRFWAKKSPVLFPIVGTLKNNTYFYNHQPYHLSRHGFAREKEFSVRHQSPTSLTFFIESDEESLKVFPFSFHFSITYTVTQNELLVTYSIRNKGEEAMFFSVGAHPAFKIPLVENTVYSDYELVFNAKENAGRWPISKEGLIEKEPVPFFNNTDVLPLNKDLFKADALVFKHLQSNELRLQSHKTTHGFTLHFKDFPYLGLWAAPQADFLCIEPWCGIADSVDADQQWQHKEGIVPLPAGGTFEVSWDVEVF